jgi:glycosyltransferase involved in cell wall biosynthesis
MALRILIVAFEFPPTPSIGAVRPHEFARHWALAGHSITVVTADHGKTNAAPGHDLPTLPNSVVVHRIACPAISSSRFKSFSWLRFFFTYIGDRWAHHWKPNLYKHWKSIIAEARPDVIYVTIPPFSMAPLVCELARSVGIPLVIDFRDAWSQWSSTPRTTWFHHQLQLRAERYCLNSAHLITGVTQQLLDDLIAAHPSVSPGKFSVVPNGFDMALEPFTPERISAHIAPFMIGYVGRFYYYPDARETVMTNWWRRPVHRWLHYAPRREDWLYRSPWFFLLCVRHFVTQHPERRSELRIRFVGERENWLKEQIASLGLEDVVELVGRLPHDACLKFQSKCDALLLTSVKVLGGRDFCIAGKTFEYLATGRPIIACVTEGEQRDILLHSGVAIICDPDQIEASSDQLIALLDGKAVLARNEDFVFKHSRIQTSLSMLHLIRSICVGQNSHSIRP